MNKNDWKTGAPIPYNGLCAAMDKTGLEEVNKFFKDTESKVTANPITSVTGYK
jgi:hypothetical protein